MFAAGRDKLDEQMLIETEEPNENAFPGEKENKVEPKADYSLMTWVFNRRLLIEPYCE